MAFVKEALYDPTKVWSLLPQDNTTELVGLMHELVTQKADLRLLVNQFLQLSDGDLDNLRADVSVALVLLWMFEQGLSSLNKLLLDPAGRVAAGFAVALVELLPDSLMFEAIRHFPRRPRPPSTQSTATTRTPRSGPPIRRCWPTTRWPTIPCTSRVWRSTR